MPRTVLAKPRRGHKRGLAAKRCPRCPHGPSATLCRSALVSVRPGAHGDPMATVEASLPRPVAAEITPRALPANVDAEAAFLGAVLIDNRVIEELATKLRPDHFYEPVHTRIFERVLQLMD